MDEPRLPALAYALAEKVGGVPMRYREDGEHIIILMTDGRKFYFDREEPGTSPSIEIPIPPPPPPHIDPSEAYVNPPASVPQPSPHPVGADLRVRPSHKKGGKTR